MLSSTFSFLFIIGQKQIPHRESDFHICIRFTLYFQELYGLDVLHKFNWIRLIARMFEAMAGKID